MRPPEFTGGNSALLAPVPPLETGFNEAAGIHRRKLGLIDAVWFAYKRLQ